jgi:predicted flap endonuclease-1-like 5' DNA nuclease
MSDMHPGSKTAFPPVEEATRSEDIADVNVAEAEAAMVEADVEAAPPPESEPDDLKIIEGIGPSIAGLLRENGIVTFRQLAAAPVDRLVEILTAARLNRLADPATWPEQAALAAKGKWEALEQLQQTLKGGRRARLN